MMVKLGGRSMFLALGLILLISQAALAGSFEKRDADGNTLPDSADFSDGWVTVYDSNTDLLWEVKTAVGTVFDYTGAESHVTDLNNQGLGGFSTGWDIPTKHELLSILDYSRTNPAVDPTFFPNIASATHWSSTPPSTDSGDADYRMVLNLSDGEDGSQAGEQSKLSNHYVLAVRRPDGAAAPPAPSFTKLDSSGGALDDTATDWAMIKDNVTGLVWEKKTSIPDGTQNPSDIHDPDNEYVWSDIDTNFIQALNDAAFGGYTDWRMPTIKELFSIVNYNVASADIYSYSDYFPNTDGALYWTATNVASDSNKAWRILFTIGDLANQAKTYDYQVRAVRGGTSAAVIGDMNGDGDVDLSDSIVALKIAAGVENPGFSTTYPVTEISVTGDPTVGLIEAVYVLQETANMR